MKRAGVGVGLGLLFFAFSLGGCIDLSELDLGLDERQEEHQSDNGSGSEEENCETTTFHGNITNPTGMLRREAEAMGAYAIATNSTLNVIAVVETGETVVSTVGPGGDYSVTVQSFLAAVMIVFAIDLDSDGDMDVFEGTLMFSASFGMTSQITAGGGTVDLGTTTLTAGLNETSDLSGSLLSDLDADNDGINDFADVDDDQDGEADVMEDENDEDNDGVPDVFDQQGFDDPDDGDCDNDGVCDQQDVNVQISIQIDFNFSFDQN